MVSVLDVVLGSHVPTWCSLHVDHIMHFQNVAYKKTAFTVGGFAGIRSCGSGSG